MSSEVGSMSALTKEMAEVIKTSRYKNEYEEAIRTGNVDMFDKVLEKDKKDRGK